jgi:hypothetical protein
MLPKKYNYATAKLSICIDAVDNIIRNVFGSTTMVNLDEEARNTAINL